MFPKQTGQFLAKTAKHGLPIVVTLLVLNFLSIVLGLLLQVSRPPGPIFWMSARIIIEAVSQHAIAGFFVGIASMSLGRALIGAAFQPLIDIDHISAFLDLGVDPRIGHSFFVFSLLIVGGLLLRAWPWGEVDLVSFISAQFAIHFAIAPSGFPLLAPFVGTTIFFPSLIPGSIGLTLVTITYLGSRTQKRIPNEA